ncbi:MAG: transporter substrate-binding domain-containing protein [Promethearchaeota archaeon]
MKKNKIRYGTYFSAIILSLLVFGGITHFRVYGENLSEEIEISNSPLESEEIDPVATFMTIDNSYLLPADQNLIIENNRINVSALHYSDNFTYPIHLEDGNGNPLVNVPVGFQVGIIPNLKETDYLTMDDPATIYTGDYLYIQDPMAQKFLQQDPLGRPLTYPFEYYNSESSMEEWQTWAPLQYEFETTDMEGNVQLTFDGKLIIGIEQYVGERLCNFMLSRIALYVRIFYNPSFNSREMQIPEIEDWASPYPVNFEGCSSDFYNFESEPMDFGGSPIFSDPLHQGTYLESFIVFGDEDTMLISSPQIINNPNDFCVYVQLVEADIINDTYIPETENGNNFLATYGCSYYGFLLDLEIYNSTSNISIIPVQTTGFGSGGIFEYRISISSVGESIKNFLPGFYTLNFTPNYSSLKQLYNFPIWRNESLKVRDPFQEVLDRGTLLVGVEALNPPFESHNLETDEIVGFEPDIIKLIASHLGVEIDFINVSLDNIFSRLDEGDYDCIISSMEYSYALDQTMDFTRWYYRSEAEEYFRIVCQENAVSLIFAFNSVLDEILGEDLLNPEISEIYNDIHITWFGTNAMGYINEDSQIDDISDDDDSSNNETSDNDPIDNDSNDDNFPSDDDSGSSSMIGGFPVVYFLSIGLGGLVFLSKKRNNDLS